ncbi:response regulator transcription factor [Egbenema bharatensis]|uniref:response regulator transcription factor n=1 Tax=Egbenema bharatensis TaxID=3463334 RepID=UPI003A88D4DF
MKKILVIEDEAQTRDIFLRCLSFEGFWSLGAENGSIGITLAKMHHPDLIVCDIMMPDVDGYGVLNALRQEPATAAVPFVFLTAKVTMADLRQGMELGADDYLTKPCTVEQFLSAVTTRLERQAALEHWYTHRSELPEPDDSFPNLKLIFPQCPKLNHVFRFIESHYHQSIGLSDVAQAVGYSPAYLTNLVQAQTGRTVKRWIIERRMAQARTLLTTTAQSVRQVAESVGYSDTSYFVRQFRQMHGTSPHAWRSSDDRIEERSISAQAG